MTNNLGSAYGKDLFIKYVPQVYADRDAPALDAWGQFFKDKSNKNQLLNLLTDAINYYGSLLNKPVAFVNDLKWLRNFINE